MTLTKIDDRGLKTPIDLLDNEKIRLGTGNDLEIYHNGSNSYIKEANAVAGQFIIDGYNGTDIRQGATGEHMIRAIGGGSVELYHNGTKKFETTNTGITVTGGLTASGASTFNEDVALTGANYNVRWDKSGNTFEFDDNAEITLGTDVDLRIYHTAGYNYFRMGASNSEIHFKDVNNGNIAKFKAGGNNELYYDTSKKFETFSGGVRVHGELLMQNNSLYLNDNAKLRLGTGQDFNIFHDGTDNIFQSGGLHNFIFKPKDTDVGLKVIGDGGVELYFDNSKKFEVTASGVSITGNTIAVKPCKVIQNTNVTDTTGNRFQVDLPSTSRMFRLTGSFSFDGSNTYRIWGHLGGWSDSHTASLEGFANFWVDGASGDLEQDVTSGSYFEVADPVDSGNLEVTYDILITSMAHNGGARPGVSGNISWTYNGVGRAWTVFSYQDTAAAGTDRLLYFAWDIDNVSGDPGTGKHQYVLEEFPLTQ